MTDVMSEQPGRGPGRARAMASRSGAGVLDAVDEQLIARLAGPGPRGRPAAGRRRSRFQRLQHQVVVIEHPLQPLATLIGVEQRVAEPHQRDAGVDQPEPARSAWKRRMRSASACSTAPGSTGAALAAPAW